MMTTSDFMVGDSSVTLAGHTGRLKVFIPILSPCGFIISKEGLG
jgi:hypothetical protein